MSTPFTYDELLSVFKRVAPASEASALAQGVLAADLVSPSESHGGGIAYRSMPHVELTQDTLILLALLSETTAMKVRDFRDKLRAGQPESKAEAEAWTNRYADLKRWADAGYPLEE